jgi:hypothetical protein
MRSRSALLALSLAVAVAPAALAHGGPKSGDHPKPEPPAAGAAKPDGSHTGKPATSPKLRTMHLAQACVVAAPDEDGVDLRVLSVNAHMRRALAGGRTFTAKIGDGTLIRLVGKARRGDDGARLPRIGAAEHLAPGDWVTVQIRAPRRTAAAGLPAAFRIIDHGPGRRCAVPAPAPAPTDPAPPAEGGEQTPPPGDTTPAPGL